MRGYIAKRWTPYNTTMDGPPLSTIMYRMWVKYKQSLPPSHAQKPCQNCAAQWHPDTMHNTCGEKSQGYCNFVIRSFRIIYFSDFCFLAHLFPSNSLTQLTKSEFGHFRPRYGHLKCWVPYKDISCRLYYLMARWVALRETYGDDLWPIH